MTEAHPSQTCRHYWLAAEAEIRRLSIDLAHEEALHEETRGLLKRASRALYTTVDAWERDSKEFENARKNARTKARSIRAKVEGVLK